MRGISRATAPSPGRSSVSPRVHRCASGRLLAFVVLVTAVYLFVVEQVKRRPMKRLLA